MPILQSKINTQSADYQQRQRDMQLAVDDLHSKVAAVLQGGGPSYRERHLASGR